ncbi:hypothetical protein [Haloferula sp. BvORR071]|uniref:hypothetical protein n=1 Tax=Haloferula sp. BvORR071 TaxID=1396141 RepID=UPI00055896D0|nr:hypothetical protein [Haloferula sp. BvORR071]
MRDLVIKSLLGAGLTFGVCSHHAKAEGVATLEEAKKAQSHVLASKELEPSPKGQTLTMEELTEMKLSKLTVKVGDKTMEGSMERRDRSVANLVSLGDNKSRRTLESDIRNAKMTLNGKDRPTPHEEDPLLKVPVLLEYKDGKYSAKREDGATAKGAQIKALEELGEAFEQDSGLALYGETPRKVGDKWKVDPQALTAFGEARKISGTYTMEFAAIEEFQGTPCAVLKAQFEIAGEGDVNESGEGPKMALKFKGSAVIHRSLTELRDLESSTSADMTVDTSPQPGMTMHMEGPFKKVLKTVVEGR